MQLSISFPFYVTSKHPEATCQLESTVLVVSRRT